MFCSANEIPWLSSTISVALAQNMTADELNIIGNLLASIGSDMMTIAAIRQSNEESADNSK